MQKRKRKRSVPITCELFRALSQRAMTAEEKRTYENAIGDHERSCLSCNEWLLDQYLEVDQLKLSSTGKKLVSAMLATIQERIDNLRGEQRDSTVA